MISIAEMKQAKGKVVRITFNDDEAFEKNVPIIIKRKMKNQC